MFSYAFNESVNRETVKSKPGGTVTPQKRIPNNSRKMKEKINKIKKINPNDQNKVYKMGQNWWFFEGVNPSAQFLRCLHHPAKISENTPDQNHHFIPWLPSWGIIYDFEITMHITAAINICMLPTEDMFFFYYIQFFIPVTYTLCYLLKVEILLTLYYTLSMGKWAFSSMKFLHIELFLTVTLL